jgi:hypothetical protein
MVQLEGPVVQSIYDSALLSWWTTLNPRPPLLYQTPQYPDTLDRSAFQFGAEHTAIHGKGDLQATAERTVQLLATDSSSKSDDAVTDFTPIVVHKSHDPFPIALVNRTPRGRECRYTPSTADSRTRPG